MSLAKAWVADRPAADPRTGRLALVLGDAAIAAWLWYALRRFNADTASLWPAIAAPAAAAALVSGALGLIFRARSGALPGLLRAAAMAAALGAIGWLAPARLGLGHGQALWLACAAAALSWLQRAVFRGALEPADAGPMEVARWIAVGLGGTLAMRPFYHSGNLGSGDAHWYAIMLGDFVAQLRAGTFPVWVGQSVYAFSGAVEPIRYAPGFLYLGGALDFLTGHTLQISALRNADLAVAAVLGAYSAYACLRPILKGAPWIACALALLWISCPGVLAPPMLGDMYMTFTTVPFAPLVLHGCWRVWRRDDRWGRLWIAAGLAGLWLCHPPIAAWFTLLSAGLYLPTLFRGAWGRQWRQALLMAGFFIVLGSVPFLSVMTLDNQLKVQGSAQAVVSSVHATFPGNFLPIDPILPGLETHQLGYALLGAFALSLVLLAVARPPGALAFALACFAVAPFTLPVPWISDAFWMHAPNWFLVIQNSWPMQRLFLVWSLLMAFSVAIVLGSPRVSGRRPARAALCAGLLCGVLWSGHEVQKIHRGVIARRGSPERAVVLEGESNLVLTRYAYSTFSRIPQYFSHSYMEPVLENRLLDLDTLDVAAANADAAAPQPGARGGGPQAAVLVQSGQWVGHSIGSSVHYELLPALHLEAGRPYALRVEFEEPGTSGTLQITSKAMFREYALPDSGAGEGARPRPQAFGSLASSSHVVPLFAPGSGPVAPLSMFVAPRFEGQTAPFARFWLYAYDPAKLPVAVTSWIPYRARVTAQRASYVESPRVWLNGWRAWVNGVQVAAQRSPENLVMVAVPAGASWVELRYEPPLALAAAFWMGAAGWSSLAALGLLQLALWSGGRRLDLGGLRPPRAAADAARALLWAPQLALGFAARHKAALAVAILLLAGLGAVARRAELRRRHLQADIDAVGPALVQFRVPENALGTTQPLIATGHAGAGTVISIKFLSDSRARLYADVWGSLFVSDPVEVDPRRLHSLVLSDSALYPLANPRVAALSPPERDRLRSTLVVELDGSTVFHLPGYAYESTRTELVVGAAPFGSLVGQRYLGEISPPRRLPIPRTMTLAATLHARLRVGFFGERLGDTEPVASLTAGPEGRLLYATRLETRRLRIAVCSGGGGTGPSSDFDFDPEGDHDIELWAVGARDGSAAFSLACTFDGKALFGERGAPCAIPPVMVTAMNVVHAPGVPVRFTGRRLDAEVLHDEPAAPLAGTWGPEHLIVTLPPQALGHHEPLLTTGRTGAGDIVYAIYEDAGHVRIGFDHWAYGGPVSAPIAVDYRIPHELWISMGALFPAQGDSAAWKGCAPSLRHSLASTLTVVLDGKVVLSAPASNYPTRPGEVVAGANRIGGSTCEAEFTGAIGFAERAGIAPPPWPRR